MSISFIWYQLFWIGALDEAYVTSWKSGLNFNALDLLISVLSNKAVLAIAKVAIHGHCILMEVDVLVFKMRASKIKNCVQTKSTSLNSRVSRMIKDKGWVVLWSLHLKCTFFVKLSKIHPSGILQNVLKITLYSACIFWRRPRWLSEYCIILLSFLRCQYCKKLL